MFQVIVSKVQQPRVQNRCTVQSPAPLLPLRRHHASVRYSLTFRFSSMANSQGDQCALHRARLEAGLRQLEAATRHRFWRWPCGAVKIRRPVAEGIFSLAPETICCLTLRVAPLRQQRYPVYGESSDGDSSLLLLTLPSLCPVLRPKRPTLGSGLDLQKGRSILAGKHGYGCMCNCLRCGVMRG